MSFLFKEIATAYKNVYKGVNVGKKYTEPKIYHGGANFDLSKRWYVYYSFLDPDTGKLKRQTPITIGVNKDYKTKKERLKYLEFVKEELLKALKKGRSPYKNKKLINYSIESCLDYALSVKEKEVTKTTFADYKQRVSQFKKYLERIKIIDYPISELNKKIVSEFLNTYDGAKNRNNVKVVLSSLFNILSNESYIEFNYIKEIRNLKVEDKPVKIYTEKDIIHITELLKENDYDLLMFIRFVSYMFWRPVEILRIEVSDIDFDKGVIKTKTKTKALKTKIIPKILIEELRKFVKNKQGFVFKPKGFEEWDIEENEKRVYFTRRFSRFRKKFNIDPDFKLYSFRHTYITKIYLELRKEMTKEESIKHLSLITGHESKAIYNYIQVNDVELPEDYSDYLK